MNLLGAPAYSRFLLCYSLGVLCIIQEFGWSPSGYAHISQQKGNKNRHCAVSPLRHFSNSSVSFPFTSPNFRRFHLMQRWLGNAVFIPGTHKPRQNQWSNSFLKRQNLFYPHVPKVSIFVLGSIFPDLLLPSVTDSGITDFRCDQPLLQVKWSCSDYFNTKCINIIIFFHLL